MSDTPEPGDRIDPRFDPMFQRGYVASERGASTAGDASQRAQRPTARGEAAGVEPSAAADGPTASDGATVGARTPAPTVGARTPAPTSSAPAPSPTYADVEDWRRGPEYAVGPKAHGDVAETHWRSAHDTDDDQMPEPGRSERPFVPPASNPYLAALWVVGIGLVVAGIVAYAASAYAAYQPGGASGSTFALVAGQIGWTLATPLITVGLATIVGLVFVRAWQFARARR